MADPISPHRVLPTGVTSGATPAGRSQKSSDTADFAAQLRQQLEAVSNMQAEAEAGIQNLMTGRTDNITEVFSTARKAEVAFSLLMEIRNKLTDAYAELRQLRV